MGARVLFRFVRVRKTEFPRGLEVPSDAITGSSVWLRNSHGTAMRSSID